MKRSRPKFADFHAKVPMEDMMEAVGVDILAVIDVDGGVSYVKARAACHACACKPVCRDWLAGHSEGEPQDFCANADFFRGIKSEDR